MSSAQKLSLTKTIIGGWPLPNRSAKIPSNSGLEVLCSGLTRPEEASPYQSITGTTLPAWMWASWASKTQTKNRQDIMFFMVLHPIFLSLLQNSQLFVSKVRLTSIWDSSSSPLRTPMFESLQRSNGRSCPVPDLEESGVEVLGRRHLGT